MGVIFYMLLSIVLLYLNFYTQIHIMKSLADFVKQKRKEVNLTQEEFAGRLGIALTVVRKIEQGKTNMQLDKVNLILNMFGHTLAPVSQKEIEQ